MMELTFAQKENIGFQYILESLHPNSPYGGERVRELRPFAPEEKPELQRQLGNIRRVLAGEEQCRKTLNQLLRVFMSLKMIRPTAVKCLETTLNEIELFELKRFLLKSQEMLPLFRELQAVFCLEGITLEDTEEALNILDPEGNRVATFYIADGYSQTLRTLRKEKRELEERLRRLPQGEEKETLQAQRARIAAEEELEEGKIRQALTQALRPHIRKVLHNMASIADLDLTVEKARLARKYGGTEPVFTEGRLSMENMVSPRIADLLTERGKTFTPVSITLEKGATVITGANMGGKSVA